MDSARSVPVSLIDVRPYGAALREAKTRILMKSPTLEIIRLVVLAGQDVAEHRARGEITVQGLEGSVDFVIADETRRIEAGGLLHLPPGERHAVHGIVDASLLVTIMLR